MAEKVLSLGKLSSLTLWNITLTYSLVRPVYPQSIFQTRVVLRRVTMHIELCLSIVSANYSLCTDLGAVQAIVGEWSCVLTEDSWKLETGSRNDSVKAFGLAQSKRYQDRAGGSFFWTWKVRRLAPMSK